MERAYSEDVDTKRAHRWRGIFVDLALVAFCLAALVTDMAFTANHGFTGAAVVAAVAATLPILTRRKAPVLSFVVAMALIVGLLETSGIYTTLAFPAMICGYTMADRYGRGAAIAAAAIGIPTVVVMMQLYSPHPFLDWETAKNLAFVALPLALGVAAHDRRAYTGVLVERAESAERTREEEALRRVSEERLRIARDVHDIVAHAMVAINVQSGVGAHLLEKNPEQARATLREIKRVSGESLDDLRSMLGVLRDGDTDELDLLAPVRPTQGIADLDELRERLGAAGVDLDVELDPSLATLPATVGATGYRIVQEALTNVLRHAGPTAARVRIARNEDAVTIEVDNDQAPGRTPLAQTGSGNGLRGMRERASAVGGSLEAGPRADGGWRVAASLPVGVS